MKQILGSLIAMTVCLLSTLSFSGSKEIPLSDLVQRIEEAHESILDLRADFRQETFFGGFETKVLSKGEILFKKPGRLRWTYHEPGNDEVLVNPEHVWVYSPNLKQVIVRPFSDFSDSQIPVRLLIEMAHLDRDFSIEWTQESSSNPPASDDKPYSLRLIPRDKASPLKSILVDVRPKDFLVTRIDMVESNGNRSSITFEKIKTNTRLKEKLFDFRPPKGIQVIELPGP